MKSLEGNLVASGLKLAICVSRFNGFVTERLLEGAVDTFTRHGGDAASLQLFRCPGAFELGPLAQRVAESGQYDGVVVLGAVIRGGTDHYEHVCGAVTRAIGEVSMRARCAVAFGVLTVDTLEQAIDRAGAKSGNKGGEAMLAAIEQANLYRAFGGTGRA